VAGRVNRGDVHFADFDRLTSSGQSSYSRARAQSAILHR
jgi:hypothetical protein